MAVLSSFAYARTRVRSGKTGQRVRLGAVITATIGGVFNLTRRETGEYSRTSQRSGAPYFAWTSYSTPPLLHDIQIPAPTCTEARFAWTPQGHLLTCNNGGVIEERFSSDDGVTFSAPVARFASARHPDITAGRSGILVELAYRAGTIVGARQTPAGATPSAEFTLKDSVGADLTVEDDSFRVVPDGRNWWWIHLRPAGGGGTQLWFSTDIDVDGASFAETSGSVPGITSGEAPGLCYAEASATLYAWARVGSSGWITYRHSGSEEWAAPVEMIDADGDPLEFAPQPFSITGTFEGPDRLVLAAVMDGDTVVTEWYSADPAGVSWAPFPGT